MEQKLTYSKILKFWLPLSATWLMMSIEGPYLTALIARMPEPEFNLAAYGVAFSIALIVESPVIMLMSASIALVENKNSFCKLRSFVYMLNLLLILFMSLLIFFPVYDFIFIDILNLPERVAHLTHMAVALLIPWAPAIGYRRFYQGVLIKNNLTRKVAYGTVIRLTAMSLTAFVLFTFSESHGVVVGAAALSAGVIAEAIITRFMAAGIVKKIRSGEDDGKKISYGEIISFYYPLVLTSFISLGIHPVVVFFLGQSRMSLESLAVLPVLNSFVFIFRAFGLSYQEAGVALMKREHEFVKLKNFAAGLAVSVVAVLGIISFTSLSELWLKNVSGLSNELTNFAKLPLMIYTFFPATTAWINFQRSILVYNRNTKPISFATLIEVTGIVLILTVTIKFFDVVGVTAAIISYTLGRIAAIGYLTIPFNEAKRKIKTIL
ncbi:MAG: hypothetical protein HYS25_15100 [Ignavibacteriales bacterium]|nr:hypothetical protein [Ignavibacteriales bacterium]